MGATYSEFYPLYPLSNGPTKYHPLLPSPATEYSCVYKNSLFIGIYGNGNGNGGEDENESEKGEPAESVYYSAYEG